MGYNPWGCKELDMTEQLTFHFMETLDKSNNDFTSGIIQDERKTILQEPRDLFREHQVIVRLDGVRCTAVNRRSPFDSVTLRVNQRFSPKLKTFRQLSVGKYGVVIFLQIQKQSIKDRAIIVLVPVILLPAARRPGGDRRQGQQGQAQGQGKEKGEDPSRFHGLVPPFSAQHVDWAAPSLSRDGRIVYYITTVMYELVKSPSFQGGEYGLEPRREYHVILHPANQQDISN